MDLGFISKDFRANRQTKYERGLAVIGTLHAWRRLVSPIQRTVQEINWR